MEVLLAQPSPEFALRLARAVDVVERALHVYSAGELVISFNGGKDSTATLHVLRAALARRAQRVADGAATNHHLRGDASVVGAAEHSVAQCQRAEHVGECPPGVRCIGAELDASVPAVYFDTPDEFPAVTEFMVQTSSRYGFAIERLPRFPSGMSALVARGVRAVLMGTRRTDPDGVEMEHFSPTSVNWPPLMRVCPVLDWAYADVWTFLRGAHLAYCALYDHGYTSLGTVADSAPNPLLRRQGCTAVGSGGAPGDADAVEAAAGADVAVDASGYLPAWQLLDQPAERLGRLRRG